MPLALIGIHVEYDTKDSYSTFAAGGNGGKWRTSDRNVIIPTYPNAALVNEGKYEYLYVSVRAKIGLYLC